MYYVKMILRTFEVEAPCDNCSNASHCAKEELACDAFADFVSFGRAHESRSRVPTKARFKKIMGFDSDNPKDLRKQLKEVDDSEKDTSS